MKGRRIRYGKLPKVAEQFVRSLESTLEPGTTKLYRTTLRCFHHWLRANRLSPRNMRRRQMVRWFAYLKDKGLYPGTRRLYLIRVRAYLRWLYEDAGVSAHPDELIRRSDLPKLPSYLPRPFPPDADHELQRRLRESGGLEENGLLLMRDTGLRIGELICLEYDCVRKDHKRHSFLKVPLGKLKTERLLPIKSDTHELIQTIKRHGRRNRTWLLETPSGSQLNYSRCQRALRHACEGLEISGAITTHRLRHTYATSLLNGGMSLVGVMKLLGHRDHRMTLRYAAITDETVETEYFQALNHIEKRYHSKKKSAPSPHDDPVRMLIHLERWIQKTVGYDRGDKRRAKSIAQRINRIKTDVHDILAQTKEK